MRCAKNAFEYAGQEVHNHRYGAASGCRRAVGACARQRAVLAEPARRATGLAGAASAAYC